MISVADEILDGLYSVTRALRDTAHRHALEAVVDQQSADRREDRGATLTLVLARCVRPVADLHRHALDRLGRVENHRRYCGLSQSHACIVADRKSTRLNSSH